MVKADSQADLSSIPICRRLTTRLGTIQQACRSVPSIVRRLGYRRRDFRVLVLAVETVGYICHHASSLMGYRYRLFAEILDMAMHGGFKLPSTAKPATNARIAKNNIQGGTNPGLLLQHPGHFYYSAAQCSIERYNIFRNVLESEVSSCAAL